MVVIVRGPSRLPITLFLSTITDSFIFCLIVVVVDTAVHEGLRISVVLLYIVYVQ
jgi:hypothetical protein